MAVPCTVCASSQYIPDFNALVLKRAGFENTATGLPVTSKRRRAHISCVDVTVQSVPAAIGLG